MICVTASSAIYCAKFPLRYSEMRMTSVAEYMTPDSTTTMRVGSRLAPLITPTARRWVVHILNAMRTLQNVYELLHCLPAGKGEGAYRWQRNS